MVQNKFLLFSLPAVLILAALYVMGFPFLAFILFASLVGGLFVVHGFKYFFIGTVAALLAAYFRPEFWQLLIFLPVTFFVSIGLKRGFSFYTTMFLSTLSCAASIAVYMSETAALSGTHPFESYFASPLRESFSALNTPELAPMYENVFSDEMLNSMLSLIEIMSPFIIILFSCIMSFVIYILTREIIKKFGFPVLEIHFSEIRADRNFGMIFLMLFLFSAFFSASPVSVNIIAVFAFMFLICGMSILDYYLKKGRIPGLLRTLIVFILFFLSSLMGGLIVSALFAVGLFDSFRPLRR